MSNLRLCVALIIIASANGFFSLGAWWHVAGVFNIADVGNGLAMLVITLGLVAANERLLLRNPFTILLLLYLLMVGMHISLAGFYHDQEILQSLIGARHQFYYLSFFAFLVLLPTREEVLRLLNALAVLALILFLLSLVNYYGVTLFSHRWAEGHGVRSGIERGFIPGMGVLSLALMWLASRWASGRKMVTSSGAGAVLLFAAHVFRQTRSRLIAATVVLIGLFIWRKRFKELALAAGVVALISVVWLSGTEGSLLVNLFSSSVEDVTTESGTIRGRLAQLNVALEEFYAHPYIGSGASVLRTEGVVAMYGKVKDVAALGYKSDLGYAKWLGSYGLLGALWFASFWIVVLVKLRRVAKDCASADAMLPAFVGSYLAYVAISFLTINHFMKPEGIVLLMLVLAVLVRIADASAPEPTEARERVEPARSDSVLKRRKGFVPLLRGGPGESDG
ncbi:MAG TPA: O-antigen ligase domain-containing protein [Sedimenticola sp.]|nr:O-antigen ligase domain-containing protein [Sedimenticola sp.]